MAKTKGSSDRRAKKVLPTALTIKGSPEWRDWVAEGADYCRTDTSKLVDAALVHYLKHRGFDKKRRDDDDYLKERRGVMDAIKFDRFRLIVFSAAGIPEASRREIEDRFGGKIEEDVRLDVPDEWNTWPIGSESPDDVLCVSKSQPTHYKVFNYTREINQSEFDPVGMEYTIIASEDSWESFLDTLRRLDDLAGETDPNESPDLMDQVIRSIEGTS